MIKLFAGSANEALSQKVAAELKLPIAKSEVVRFGNSEVRVRIEEDVKSSTSVVIQSSANPTDTNLMELFFFCDALRRQEARRVIGVIPYFGYARQDVQHRPGECVSSNVVIKFLESIGFAKIYTYDLHDEATEGVFTIPFKNATSFEILAQKVKTYLGKELGKSDVAIVSPDQGGIERARHFGEYFFGDGEFQASLIEKRRNINKIHSAQALDLYGDVKGKIAIIADDIITSGGTLINAAQLCLDRGASRVIAVIAHHDFSTKAPDLLKNSPIDRIFTTDTIQLRPEQKFDKLDETSIAPLIAEELRTFMK